MKFYKNGEVFNPYELVPVLLGQLQAVIFSSPSPCRSLARSGSEVDCSDRNLGLGGVRPVLNIMFTSDSK